MQPLAGKVAVITGASKGMGRVFVDYLIAAGACVVALARPSAQMDVLKRDTHERLIALHCDVTNSANVNEAVAAAVANFGGIDLLVNNAAIFHPFLLENASDKDITDHFSTNILGAIWMIRAAIPHLRKSNGQIVSISSESVMHPFPMLATYAATKAAVETLSTALADELRADGIRVTVLRSGSVAGGTGGDHWTEETKQAFYSKILETGHAHIAGEAASAESMATALVAIASLPTDICPRLIDVRASHVGIPEGAKAL